MKTHIRYTFDGSNYTEMETTIEQAHTLAILVNGLGGMFWWWNETIRSWWLSNI